jgi:scyllo-inositol 2-dehydrogenase (NADP+)
MDDPNKYGVLTLAKDGEIVSQNVKTIAGSYSTYYQKIYDHILEGKQSPVAAEEGLMTIKIIELAKQSSEEKRTIYL